MNVTVYFVWIYHCFSELFDFISCLLPTSNEMILFPEWLKKTCDSFDSLALSVGVARQRQKDLCCKPKLQHQTAKTNRFLYSSKNQSNKNHSGQHLNILVLSFVFSTNSHRSNRYIRRPVPSRRQVHNWAQAVSSAEQSGAKAVVVFNDLDLQETTIRRENRDGKKSGRCEEMLKDVKTSSL